MEKAPESTTVVEVEEQPLRRVGILGAAGDLAGTKLVRKYSKLNRSGVEIPSAFTAQAA
jgi:hypothetical protein